MNRDTYSFKNKMKVRAASLPCFLYYILYLAKQIKYLYPNKNVSAALFILVFLVE